MRALKAAVIVMGVLIVLGTIGLVVGIARRSSTAVVPVVAALPLRISAVLDEPAGTHIAGITALRDKLAVQLQGGGADRIVLIDPASGGITGHISLAR